MIRVLKYIESFYVRKRDRWLCNSQMKRTSTEEGGPIHALKNTLGYFVRQTVSHHWKYEGSTVLARVCSSLWMSLSSWTLWDPHPPWSHRCPSLLQPKLLVKLSSILWSNEGAACLDKAGLGLLSGHLVEVTHGCLVSRKPRLIGQVPKYLSQVSFWL